MHLILKKNNNLLMIWGRCLNPINTDMNCVLINISYNLRNIITRIKEWCILTGNSGEWFLVAKLIILSKTMNLISQQGYTTNWLLFFMQHYWLFSVHRGNLHQRFILQSAIMGSPRWKTPLKDVIIHCHLLPITSHTNVVYVGIHLYNLVHLN